MKHYIPTLTIAGSDCSGGAGIAADIKTMSALGCLPSLVITAVTAQDAHGVHASMPMPPDLVTAQLETVLRSMAPVAVKIGMLPDSRVIDAVATTLRRFPSRPVVIDPVMVATSGSRLMDEEAIGSFIHELLPLATLLTPNIPETACLTGLPVDTPDDLRTAALRLREMGARDVLIKGGHHEGKTKNDLLLTDNCFHLFSAPTLQTTNTHGTGCVLSSAITAFLAHGLSMPDAVSRAKEFLYQALLRGKDYDMDHGPALGLIDPP
ncbi:MAG: bifunctional hydroxymethylpyrimidine kinase/phosphomethylpyrimidine kinase [Prevotellaceae bacterium]|nr:bifunctional hydroxymethylpyrimidine kinase/phosphomethylpyrimidine kinase [Prevotellaceae bacterium]